MRQNPVSLVPKIQEPGPVGSPARKNCWFAVVIGAALLVPGGCRGKGGGGLSQPTELPAEMTHGIIQSHWTDRAVKVSNISYDPPVPSKGGRVPAGIKLFPAKVRLSVEGGPEEVVLFYFSQNAFGAWEAYTE